MEAALFVIGFAIGAVVTLFFFFKLLIYEDHPMEVLGLVFGLFMIVLALSVCK
jgi:heme/copper-type cytochrome/quinol oxidase subunit 4